MLGLTEHNSIYMNKFRYILLYEYANTVWSPHKRGDIIEIKNLKKSHQASHSHKKCLVKKDWFIY